MYACMYACMHIRRYNIPYTGSRIVNYYNRITIVIRKDNHHHQHQHQHHQQLSPSTSSLSKHDNCYVIRSLHFG